MVNINDDIKARQVQRMKDAADVCKTILPHLWNVQGFGERDLINETVKYCFIFKLENENTQKLREILKYLIGYRMGL